MYSSQHLLHTLQTTTARGGSPTQDPDTEIMQREVSAAVDYLKRFIVVRGKQNEAQAGVFAEKLQKLLCDKFENHWYPETPTKGQAFRCIRINRRAPIDAAMLEACKESELKFGDLGFPAELTVWIDPLEVCVRAGENSMPFRVACFDRKEDDTEPKISETSDYHSASSSDCCSSNSSDTEEEVRHGQLAVTKEMVEGVPLKMVPVPAGFQYVPPPLGMPMAMSPPLGMPMAMSPPPGMPMAMSPPPGMPMAMSPPPGMPMAMSPPPGMPMPMPPPSPMWPQYPPYQRPAPVFVTPMCTSLPPPPKLQPVYSYFYLQQPPQPPQFILPVAARQPWGAVQS